MKKMKSLLMLMAIAAASFTFTSCDDDYWDDDRYWHDDYGWYEDYNQGGWGWNQGDWNQGSGGSQNSLLVEEAQTLVGRWYGPVTYSYINEDGVSRGKDEFYATMIFYQSGIVITFPCHESDQRVLTKSKFSVCCGRTICDNLSCLYVLTLEYDWFLVITVTLVTSQIFSQMVIIFCTIIILNADICRCGTKYSTRFLCNYADTGVNCCLNFHTSTNYPSLCCQKRHSLTLHV